MKGPFSILLTGAANGIVRATAERLAARGHRLGLIDRDGERLRDLAASLGRAGAVVAARSADVTDDAGLRGAIAGIEAELGGIDLLVAGAGIGSLIRYPDLDPADLMRTLEVNVVGVVRTIDAVLPGMIRTGRGHVVAISSVAGYRGLPWMPAYSASKAALTTYLEGIRPALKRRGVRITTVHPGFVRTGLTVDTPFRYKVPMLEPEQAARHLVRAIERRPRDAAFPASAAIGMGFLRSLPGRLFDRMMDDAGPRALTTEF
jgi:short-subunit dehydrogenase